MPLVLSGILQQLYSWADAFIIGHAEGELQLGAVGATTSLFVFLINMITGFSLGLSILAAQEYGRGNTEKIREILNRFRPVFLGVSIAVSTFVILLIRPILHLMNTPAEIFDYSLHYLQIILVGVPFLAVYNLYASLLRAVGNTKVAFYAVLISSGLNIVGDILLVAVLSYGVAGAAFATILSQAAMTVFIVLYARTKYPNILKGKSENTKGEKLFKEGFSFGLPPTIQNSITSLGNIVLQNFMNGFGAITVLAITTAYRVDSIMLLPIINLGAAISSLVARAKGANDSEKMKNYCVSGLTLMIVIAGSLAAVMYFFGATFIGFFGVTGEALEGGASFFRDISIFYVFFGIAVVLRSVLEGMGDLKYCSFMGISALGVRVVMSYVLRPAAEMRAIALAEGISWTMLLVVFIVRIVVKRREFDNA